MDRKLEREKMENQFAFQIEGRRLLHEERLFRCFLILYYQFHLTSRKVEIELQREQLKVQQEQMKLQSEQIKMLYAFSMAKKE